MRYLSYGEDLARTLSCFSTILKLLMFLTTSLSSSVTAIPYTKVLNYLPCITAYSCPGTPFFQFLSRIPAYFAMAIAVYSLSPVTIRTVMPALLHFYTDYTISGRRGSLMPTNPINIRSSSPSLSRLS